MSLAAITTKLSIMSRLGSKAGSCIDCFEYLPNAGTRPASRRHALLSNSGSRAFHNILPITTRSHHLLHPNISPPRSLQRGTSTQQNIPDMLPLKPNSIQPPNPNLPLRLLRLLALLGQPLHRLYVPRLVPRRRVVVLVQVDLAQQQDVLAAHEEDAAGDVGVEAWGVGVCGGDEDSFDGGLEDEVCLYLLDAGCSLSPLFLSFSSYFLCRVFFKGQLLVWVGVAYRIGPSFSGRR